MTTRRSARLSESKPQKSSVWKHRQTRSIAISDSDDDSDSYNICSESDSENIENRDLMNDTKKLAGRRSARKEVPAVEVMKTPRSKRLTSVPQRIEEAATPKAQRSQQGTKKRPNLQVGDDNYSELSPPKVARTPPQLDKQLLSPVRLLDRLSIDDDDKRQKCVESPVPEVSPSRSKYQNARRVLNNAETLTLPGRETQLQELRDFFTRHLKEQKSGSMYVSGQPGTGKTACLSLLLKSPELANRLQCAYVNCTSIASVGAVYKKLCAELRLQPTGRTERDHLAAIQHHLQTTKRMVLLVLDEIDQLCSSRQEVLYTIFEWPALPKAKLLLVGIANSLDLTDRALKRLNARCELKPQLMHFPPYNKQQIIDIFKSRLEEAGVLDVFPSVTLQLLAAKVSAVSGDVRRALDIGRRVVEIAEQQKKAGEREIDLKDLGIEVGAQKQKETATVQVRQVAEVLSKVYGASQNLQVELEESFPLQQKLMLCSLLLMLRKERNKDITLGRVHEVYRRVCEKRNINALDQAEFNGMVDLVETRGIIRIVRKKESRLNKVILQWDAEEVNGALKDKQLIASILDDTACLSR